MKSGGFTETGGAAALTGLAAGGDTAFSTLGIRAASPLHGWSNVAMKGGGVDGLSFGQWYFWLRPAFQPLIIFWVLYAAGVMPGKQAALPIARPGRWKQHR